MKYRPTAGLQRYRVVSKIKGLNGRTSGLLVVTKQFSRVLTKGKIIKSNLHQRISGGLDQ